MNIVNFIALIIWSIMLGADWSSGRYSFTGVPLDLIVILITLYCIKPEDKDK